VDTGSDGKASTTFLSEPSVQDITATVTAKATGDGGTITEAASVKMRGVTVQVDADPDQVPADGISTSRVYVRLSETTSGSPISGATVGFGTSLGAIGGSTNTDSEGFGSVYLLAGTVPGVAEVTAAYGYLAAKAYVTFGGLDLTLSAPLPRMVADGVSTQRVVATLLTEDNNPVRGVSIDFATTHGVISGKGTTDSRGQAMAVLVSAAQEATAEVSASFTGNYTDDLDVIFEDPVIDLYASPVTVTVRPSDISAVTAYVAFSDDSPVPDSTQVVFETTQGTIQALRLTRSGMATADLQPNGVADDEVTVRAYAGNSMGTTKVMFVPDAPAKMSLTATPDSVAGDGSSYALVSALVTDAYGNKVEDGMVIDFAVSSGNGMVTPSSMTVSGVATAQFVTAGGSGISIVTAGCKDACSVTDYVGIRIVSEGAGAIVADPDTAWIAVAGTWDNSQATIVANVYDCARNPVEDGTDVTFEIEAGPGGGEYICAASGYGPVTKQTAGGSASITVNSGTKPGTVLMSISSPGAPTTACKVGISAGDPDSVLISLGEVSINGDGTYSLAVSAIVRDQYNNPVENGTVVYFTLDRSDIGFINPETYTGSGYPCDELEGDGIKGVTRACLTYPTESIFEQVTIIASTMGGRIGDEQVVSQLSNPLPIIDGSVTLEAFPGAVSGAAGGTVTIYVTVWDFYGLIPVDKAGIGFSVEGPGSVSPPTAVTDETGIAITTLSIPAGTEEGVSKIKARVWMSDIEGDIDITITP
jgi:adhesin/invasin